MNCPLVSIVIPAYNHEQYVAQAVTSVLQQTYHNLEVIVVDDASVDSTCAVLAGIADPRLQVHHNSKNSGAHATINRGISLAKGAFIGILNSDDAYAVDRVAQLVAFASCDTTDRIYFTNLDFIDESGMLAPDHQRAVEYRQLVEMVGSLPIHHALLTGNVVVTTSNLFGKKAIFAEVGAFNALRYTHDWDFCLRAACIGRLAWMTSSLLQYRVHRNNTLAENQVLRHVSENALVQGAFLANLSFVADERGNEVEAISRALLNNHSFHPLATLLAILQLRLGKATVSDLLDNRGNSAASWVEVFAGRHAVLPELFYSLDYWRELIPREKAQGAMILERDQTIAFQNSLVEERLLTIAQMDAMIAERDAALNATQVDLQQKCNELAEKTALLNNYFVRFALFLRRTLNAIRRLIIPKN